MKEVWVIKSDITFNENIVFLIEKLLDNKFLIFVDVFPHRYCTNYKILTTSIPGKIIQIGYLGYI